MQTNCCLNFYVAKAMLNTVVNLQSVLDEAHLLTIGIDDLGSHHSFLDLQRKLYTNLSKLMNTAQGHIKNLELTLLEEIGSGDIGVAAP